MTAVQLRERPDLLDDQWDEIVAGYPAATVFHLSCWHRVLHRARPGRVVRFEIHYDNELCGHWCGFLLQRFGARFFGAPLPGTATPYMHPLFSTVPPAGPFLEGVLTWAKEREVGLID